MPTKEEYRRYREKQLCVHCGKQVNGPTARCVTCQKKVNAVQKAKTTSEYRKAAVQKVKDKVFNKYGNVCACCGEANKKFLSVDHINNNGAEHRREIGGGYSIYYWLVKNHFPDGFQLLCFNCNLGKLVNCGVCPHTDVTYG